MKIQWSEMPQSGHVYVIDYLRFILCVLVLTIHVPSGVFIVDTFMCNGIARLCVPLFFTISGYFVFSRALGKDAREDDDSENIIKRYIFKMIRLYGTWMGLLFIGQKDHLWYLFSSAIGMIVLSLMWKKFQNYYTVGAVCVFLYVIGLLGDSYCSVLYRVRELFPFFMKIVDSTMQIVAHGTTRNGIFMAPLFIFIGAYLFSIKTARKKTQLLKRVVLSGIVFLIEVYLMSVIDAESSKNMYLSLPIFTMCLFDFVIHIQVKRGNEFLVKFSFLFYVTQMFGKWIYEYLLVQIFKPIEKVQGVFGVNYFSVAMITTFICSIILCVIRSRKIPILKYICE